MSAETPARRSPAQMILIAVFSPWLSGSCSEQGAASAVQPIESTASCGDARGLPRVGWPMLGACPTHVGRSAFSVSRRSPNAPAWGVDVPGSIDSSPVIAPDGTVLVAAGAVLYFVKEGRVVRQYAAGDSIHSTPAIGHRGVVVFGASDGSLRAVEADGRVRWRHQTDGAIDSSPVIAPDGTVIVGSDDGCLYSVSAEGERRWRYCTGAAVDSSPAISPDGRFVAVGSDDGALHAVGIDDGLRRWTYDTGAAVDSSPSVFDDGTVVVGSDDGRVHGVVEGRHRWRYCTSGEVDSSPAVATDGAVLAGSGDGCLHAIAPDGRGRWKHCTGGKVNGAAALTSDGLVAFGSDDGMLRVLDADSGSLVWAVDAGGEIQGSVALSASGIAVVAAGSTLRGFGETMLEPPRLAATGPITARRDTTTLTARVQLPDLPPTPADCGADDCGHILLYDAGVFQLGTALAAWTQSGSLEVNELGEHVITLEWDGSRDPAHHLRAPDDLYRADMSVYLVRRQGERSIALAHASSGGADSGTPRSAFVEAARSSPCQSCGATAITYPQRTERVCPLIEGTDLGQPVVDLRDGSARVALLFGDTGGITLGSAVTQSSAAFPVLSQPSPFVDPLGRSIAGNDDVLASLLGADTAPLASDTACSVSLDLPLVSGAIAPVTMNGPYGSADGSVYLGPLSVPGQAFIVGQKLFAAMPAAAGADAAVLTPWLACETDAECPPGDRCIARPVLGVDGAPVDAWNVCIIGGQCPDPLDPDAPCFVRLRPRVLGVSLGGTTPQDFVTPTAADARR